MCFIIAKRLEIESTVFLMFLFYDTVFTILYHGGYFISLQLRELGQSDNVLIYEEARTKAKIHIVHKKIEHKDGVFYITLVPTQTTIIYRKMCLTLKILRVHHLHRLH